MHKRGEPLFRLVGALAELDWCVFVALLLAAELVPNELVATPSVMVVAVTEDSKDSTSEKSLVTFLLLLRWPEAAEGEVVFWLPITASRRESTTSPLSTTASSSCSRRALRK